MCVWLPVSSATLSLNIIKINIWPSNSKYKKRQSEIVYFQFIFCDAMCSSDHRPVCLNTLYIRLWGQSVRPPHVMHNGLFCCWTACDLVTCKPDKQTFPRTKIWMLYLRSCWVLNRNGNGWSANTRRPLLAATELSSKAAYLTLRDYCYTEVLRSVVYDSSVVEILCSSR